MAKRAAALLAVVLLVHSASAQIVGWRGDGSGKYPNADSPVRWGRAAKVILELRAQAVKPKDGETGKPIPDGVIREWLVLGPVSVPEGGKLKDDFLPNEAQLAPAANEKQGELVWKAAPIETSCVDFAAIFNSYGKRPKVAAYACAWVWSPSGQPVALNFMSAGGAKFWFNGKAMFTAADQSAARLKLDLARGWNRLLFKVLASDESWYVRSILHELPGADYESRNVAWTTRTPASGNSAPVIVGNRIFVTCESGALACLNKADGRILWVRTSTYYDAATPEERKAHADVFKELDPLAAKLREMDDAAAKEPWSQKAMDLHLLVEGQLNKGMEKVDGKKYEKAPRGEAGFTAPQPVTDGKNVYVAFGHGVTVCYDLDGRRKWISLESHPNLEHGYTASPLLADGKLLVYMGELRALDANTGKVVWERPRWLLQGSGRTYCHFHGTGCLIEAGGVKLAFFNNGEFVRVSDGKTLHVDFWKLAGARTSTPVVERGLIFAIYPHTGGVHVLRPGAVADDKLKVDIVKAIPFDTAKYPRFYMTSYNASPLLYEGLMYCLDDCGVLTVVDVEKGEVVYQRMLDLDLYMHHNFGVGRGGSGSSPTLAGKHIYIFGNQGTCVVIEPGRTFKQVARNTLANLSWPGHYLECQEVAETCPIFEGKRMYLRATDNLYCVEEKR
jgi:hypothetical protein